jgi:hypothetical protein
MQIQRGAARPEAFASRISMQSDDLPISQDYVAEILRCDPVLYWRFDDADPAVVQDVAPGGRYNGRVVGAIKKVDEGGNCDLELGAGLSDESLHAYLVSEGALTDDLSQGYTLEMWVKPSHYHWGTVASLIRGPSESGSVTAHGLLFELGGPIAVPSEIERPGRIRFLHRSPPSHELNLGTSCFSASPYELRKWQHVAAVKDGAEMRLYVDGQLVASGHDDTVLPTGLRLIVGQLDESRTERRFIGQIDELAFYARALTSDEILRRYDLVRDKPIAQTVPRTPEI